MYLHPFQRHQDNDAYKRWLKTYNQTWASTPGSYPHTYVFASGCTSAYVMAGVFLMIDRDILIGSAWLPTLTYLISPSATFRLYDTVSSNTEPIPGPRADHDQNTVIPGEVLGAH